MEVISLSTRSADFIAKTPLEFGVQINLSGLDLLGIGMDRIALADL